MKAENLPGNWQKPSMQLSAHLMHSKKNSYSGNYAFRQRLGVLIIKDGKLETSSTLTRTIH